MRQHARKITGGALVVATLVCGRGVASGASPAATPPGSLVSCAADAGSAPVAAPVRLGGAASTGTRARPVAQVSHNDRVDLTLEVRPAESGGIEIAGRRGDLQIKKTVQGNGAFALELTSGHDRVAVAVNPQGTTVTRGKVAATLTRANPSEDEADRIRRALSDSKAVLQFRSVAAALIDAEDRSSAALAVIMADAVVGGLTGDVGAARRTARHLARPERARQRPVGMALDCYALMEQRFVEAWNDLYLCVGSVYGSFLYERLCGARWILQAESYWFGFMSCSGFNR